MSSSRARLAVMAMALLSALVAAGVAMASSATPPQLKSPANGARIHTGRITLKVYSPGLSGDTAPVFVAINRHRKVDKNGHLTGNCSVSKGCEFYTLKRWKGHRGWWIVTDSASFPGFWTDTPGTYYWQAHHIAPPNGLCNSKNDCELSSPIHSFHVHG